MQNMCKLLVIFCAFCTFSQSTFAEVSLPYKPVLLFIAAGQSNMEGRGKPAEYNALIPAAQLPRKDIWLRWNTTKENGGADWSPLGSGKQFGLELSFILKMAEAYPDYTIALVKVAKGATPIAFYTPGKPSQYNSKEGYLALKREIEGAVNDLKAKVQAGVIPSYKVAGFIWMQGEDNANGIIIKDKTVEYLAQLKIFLSFINEAAGTEHIPFVLGRISAQLSPSIVRESGKERVAKDEKDNREYLDGQKRGPIWYDAKLNEVRADQEAITKDYTPSAWVNIDDLPLTDAWHYKPKEYVEIGNRFATAMLPLIKK